MAGFELDQKFIGDDIPRKHLQLAPSQTVVKGDALKLVYGKLALAGTTDKVFAIAMEAKTSTATSLTYIKVQPVLGKNTLWRRYLSLSEIVTLTNADTTKAIIAQGALSGDGADNDLRGGYVLRVATGERRMIASNAYATSKNTITVAEPFSTAIDAGEYVKVLPLGASDETVQLSGNNSVAATIAGRASGKLSIFEVSALLDYVLLTFNP